ncbi:TonB-dependent receptor [Flavisolibacter ginsenosidimutans]|uniref:TonB-dependent receptor n=1 Tax=Flavisolibacter ginsenosidimutans TaxID=661481 RepID=A0A5B8UPY9_9BACT|nr:TonB-dependent receptor [Flavisolibacter ginsenosidimutans]QEC58110.1 TonB-dependent receptor [Flavisolibacter ginsenosidimutans]
MQKLLLVIVAVCFVIVANAQPSKGFSLTGKITDAQTALPLAGASVSIDDSRSGAVANAQGEYTFKNIAGGHHIIEVSYSGFTTTVLHIDISANTTKDFALVPAIREQQGIIITGVAQATNARNSPVPVSILRKAEMLQIPSTNIVDMLSRQPGVSQISTGPAVSKPVIRGLSFNRVVVVNDGVRQEGQQWGEEHGVEIDELSVTRAEVLKGPASLMYGSDALGGVVNFITNTPIPDGLIRGSVLTNLQSNNNLAGINLNLAGNNHGFNWNVYGTSRSARDYRNRFDGRVLNSRFKEANFGGYVGLNKAWGYSHLIFSAFDQHLGLVEGRRDSATGAFLIYADSPLERISQSNDYESRTPVAPYQIVKHYKVVSDNSFNMGHSRLKVNLAYQDNLRREFADPEQPTTPNLFFDLKTLDYNLQFALPTKAEWQTTFGLGGMQQSNRNKAEETLIPEYDLFDVGSFVFTQKYFGKATVSGGLRYDYRAINSKTGMEANTIKFEAFQRKFYNVSASAGISYTPVQYFTFKANLARGFRAPTLTELASNGAHEGTIRYEYGSRDLASEKSFQVDGGIEADYTHFSFTLNAFYNRIKDFIFYRRLQTSSGADSLVTRGSETFQAFRYGQSNATLSGLEVVFDFHPHPLDWLHFENTFSYVRGRFDKPLDGSYNLPEIPHNRLISELRGNFLKKGKSLRNLYVMLEENIAFAQDKPFFGYNTETATPGYQLLNAGIGTDFVNRKGSTWASLHFAVNNIADKVYQDHLNRLKYTDVNNVTGREGVFNAGRNFSVKLNIPFTFSANK